MILALALRNPLQPISPRTCDKSHLLRLLLLHAFIKHEYRTASFLPREAREARHLVKSNLRQRMWTAIRDRLTRCSALPIKLESSKAQDKLRYGSANGNSRALPDSGTLDARKYFHSVVLDKLIPRPPASPSNHPGTFLQFNIHIHRNHAQPIDPITVSLLKLITHGSIQIHAARCVVGPRK
jgi:hypothetical protein